MLFSAHDRIAYQDASLKTKDPECEKRFSSRKVCWSLVELLCSRDLCSSPFLPCRLDRHSEAYERFAFRGQGSSTLPSFKSQTMNGIEPQACSVKRTGTGVVVDLFAKVRESGVLGFDWTMQRLGSEKIYRCALSRLAQFTLRPF